MAQPRLADRLALVTGASRGIGRAVAKALAREGAHVIIASRRVGALETLDDEIRSDGGSATLVQLDLTIGEKVDVLGPTIYERWGRLDILVANAGILGPISPLPHITSDAWASVLDTNLTANWHMIRSIDPLLRKSDAGRGIFVTAEAATGKHAYWGPYAVSKAGLEALVRTYAHELANTTAKVNMINPGPVRTELRAKAYPGEDADALPTPDDVAPLFIELADPGLSANGQVFTYKAATD
ncbi:MAG: SDR family NAD(P)-dependent oxidoreductase [Hyphomicrobiaceae bacterium]